MGAALSTRLTGRGSSPKVVPSGSVHRGLRFQSSKDGAEDAGDGTHRSGERRPLYSGAYTDHLKREDVTASLEVELPACGTLCSLACVADGHGGAQTSTWLAENMLAQIAARAGDASSDALQRACVAAFAHADAAVKRLDSDRGDGGSNLCGSTLTVTVVNHKLREVTCANVGDSEALLVHGGGHETLTTSHRLDHSEEERERVKGLGHKVARAADPDGLPDGPLRAWPGGLAVTRAIGDDDCAAYVTCTPSVRTVRLPADGGVLVLCSDGVWDSLEAADVARLMVKPAHPWHSPQHAARGIVKRARGRSGVLLDDTSAVVLFFDAADPRAPSSFLSERFKPQRVQAYRRAFVLGSSSDGGAALGMDGSKLGDSEFESYDMDGSKGSSYEHSDNGSKHSATSVLELLRASGHSHSQHGASSGSMLDSTAANLNSPRDGDGDAERKETVPFDDTPAMRSRYSARAHGDGACPEGEDPPLAGDPRLTWASDTRNTKQRRRPRLSHDNIQVVRTEPDGGRPASARARLATAQDFEKIADGLDPHLRAAAEKSFRTRANSSSPWRAGGDGVLGGLSGLGTGLSGLGQQRGQLSLNPPVPPIRADTTNDRATAPTWLLSSTPRGPGEMTLWKDAELSRIIEWEHLDQSRMAEIGHGEFATAWASELDGTEVAVKVLKPHKRNDHDAVRGMKREIMLMSMMHHPNVLRVLAIGYFREDSVPFLALERLCTVLHRELPADPDTQPFWVTWRERRAWSLERALDYGLQLARALRYCHDEAVEGYRVLHRDIKPNNIGFMPPNAEERARGETIGRLVIFDFGLTSIWKKDVAWSDEGVPEREEMRRLTGECGSLRYMAPEVCNNRPYNHLSEVFSFGTVLWEMAARRKPFNNFTPEIFRSALDAGARPAIEKKWPSELKSLFVDMWQHKPTSRPEFSEVVPRLEQLLAAEVARRARKKGGGRKGQQVAEIALA